MATLRVLNARGDTKVVWKPEKVKAGDREALQAIREAEQILRGEIDWGGSAFMVKPGGPAVRLEGFDPLVEQDIIVVPRVAGGGI